MDAANQRGGNEVFATKTVIAAAVVMMGSMASASAAGPLYTETSLNLNSSLASNLSGFVVSSPPNAADPKQKWDATGRTITLPNGQKVFGWQLKNAATQKCVSDAGNNLQVREVTCETAPGGFTKQVWQNLNGRFVNGKFYWFWVNATTKRKLQVSGNVTDGPFPTFTVIATDKNANPGTALENLQLWHEKVVS